MYIEVTRKSNDRIEFTTQNGDKHFAEEVSDYHSDSINASFWCIYADFAELMSFDEGPHNWNCSVMVSNSLNSSSN